jgi:hypothetical protein
MPTKNSFPGFQKWLVLVKEFLSILSKKALVQVDEASFASCPNPQTAHGIF